jgi:ATP-binding cassette subfamily B protein
MMFKASALTDLGRYIVMVWRSSPGLTFLALALRLIRALLPVVILYVGKLIIDGVVSVVQMPHNLETLRQGQHNDQLEGIFLLLAAEFVLAVTADILGRVISLIDGLLSERMSTDASLKLMQHAAILDLQDFENADFQDQLDRARHQTTGNMTLMMQIFNQGQDMVTVASFALGLLFYEPWMILLLVVALLPAFMGEAHFNALGYALDFQRTPQRRELDYIRQTASSGETAKELKIFGLYGFLAERYLRLARGLYAVHRQLAMRRAGWGSIFSGIGTAGYYAAYAFIAWRTMTGVYSVGDLTFLAASFQRLRSLLEGLLANFSSIAGQALYLKDLFSFFELRPTVLSPPQPRPFPSPIRRGFEFEDVGFIYPGAKKWTVRNLNFTLRAGEVVALVGENGAGKTTLVKLLTRLYDPVEGRILLDGHDLREYSLEDVRSNIGVIFQDFMHYNLPVRDNIAAGKITARDDISRIRNSAKLSQVDDLIENLPHGYEQMIGRHFENGLELSGGEWQKIAIARAYMREADVLILDEPTAALDARAEFEVFKRFKELSMGRIAVLISHRFSSVRMADRILVLAGGKVEADGKHEDLIVHPGRYAELFELQAAGYR